MITPYTMKDGSGSWYVYHPKAPECMGKSFLDVKKDFLSKWDTATSIAELYNEEMPEHPQVFTPEVKREIYRLLDEIEKDAKRNEETAMYEIEALAKWIFDEQSPNKKFLPYFSEIKSFASRIRAEISGILLASTVNKELLKHEKDDKKIKRILKTLEGK